MAIVQLRQIVNLLAPADDEDRIGFALYLQAGRHFNEFLGQTGIGFGYDACNAAVAVNSHANYDPVAVPPFAPFSAVYGTSRLYSGLDPDFNNIHAPALTRPFSNTALGEHAEQTAIRVVDSLVALNFWFHDDHHHLFVDLSPCPGCNGWLQNDLRNWFVHYRMPVGFQGPVTNEKRKYRRDTFGRQMEGKRSKTFGTGPVIKKVKV